MNKETHIFHFGGNRKGKIKCEDCFKGFFDEECLKWAWVDHLGNILGFAQEDGTLNHNGSFVTVK